MATNEEVKQRLRDAIAQDHSSDAEVDAAADEVLALVQDTPVEPTNPVEDAVVEAISTKGLVETFGEEALVAELETLGYTVTAPGSDEGYEDEESEETDVVDPEYVDPDSDYEEPLTRGRR